MPVDWHPILEPLRLLFLKSDGSLDVPLIIGGAAVALLALVVLIRLTKRLFVRPTGNRGKTTSNAIERRMTERPADPQKSFVGNARETRAKLAAILQLTEQALNPTRPDEQRRQSLLTARDQIRELLNDTTGPSDAPGAHPNLPTSTSPSPAVAHPTSGELSKMRILVADESPETRRTLTNWLASAGAVVESAANGRAAIELTMKSLRSGQTYHAILLDLDLSRVDGLAAVSTLRQLGYTGQIVATSSSILAAEHKRFFDAGCSTHLIKPLARPQLLMVVAALHSDSVSKISTETAITAPQVESTDNQSSLASCSLVNDPDIQPMLTEFIGGLRQHADVLTAAFQEADLARIRAVAHQLAGCAGDYGFDAITRQARAVEMALQSTVTDANKMKVELETLTALCRKATAPRIIVPEDEN